MHSSSSVSIFSEQHGVVLVFNQMKSNWSWSIWAEQCVFSVSAWGILVFRLFTGSVRWWPWLKQVIENERKQVKDTRVIGISVFFFFFFFSSASLSLCRFLLFFQGPSMHDTTHRVALCLWASRSIDGEPGENRTLEKTRCLDLQASIKMRMMMMIVVVVVYCWRSSSSPSSSAFPSPPSSSSSFPRFYSSLTCRRQ